MLVAPGGAQKRRYDPSSSHWRMEMAATQRARCDRPRARNLPSKMKLVRKHTSQHNAVQF